MNKATGFASFFANDKNKPKKKKTGELPEDPKRRSHSSKKSNVKDGKS